MKQKRLFPLLLAACLLAVGCHKTCACLGYDLQVHNYSADEVSQFANGNCYNMRDFPLHDTYSVCNWD